MRPGLIGTVAAGLLAGACVTVPTGPGVMVLPGAGKSFEQFMTDDAVCRQWAGQQTGTTTAQVGTQSTVTGAAVGTALGAAAGAAIGAAAGSAGTGAAAGAGAGLLGGTAIGFGSGESTSYDLQRRYDMTYMQCMYAKGNQIPLPRGSQPAYAPPPPPPQAPASSRLPPGGSQPAYAAPAPPAQAPAPSTLPPGVPPPPPGPPPAPPPGAAPSR